MTDIISVPIHKTQEENLDDDDDDSTNIVNVHDPFFLWGVFEHSNRALIRSFSILSEADCSRLYWSCHYHKQTGVCQRLFEKIMLIYV